MTECWLKLHVDLLNDPKMRLLTMKERWLWVALLLICKKSNDGDKLSITTDIPFDTKTLAGELEISVKKCEILLKKFEEMQMILKKNDVIFIKNWNKRQYVCNAKYRIHRQKIKQMATEEQPTQQPSEPPQSDHRLQTTDYRLQTTDNNITPPAKTPEVYSEKFEEFWNIYPRKAGKIAAWKCWKSRLKEKHTEDELIQTAKNFSDFVKRSKTEEKFIKHPATFLGCNKWFLDYSKPIYGLGFSREETREERDERRRRGR